MVGAAALPPIRQELGIFPAPPTADGSPSWTLHDPASNRFYLLSWPAFEMLSRWGLGSFQSVVEAVNMETTLSLTEGDLLDVIAFLLQNFLLEASSPESSERLRAAFDAHRPGWAAWLLKNYLFIRIPLLRPQRFLDRAAPWVAWAFSRTFHAVVLLALLSALYLISRRWDLFMHSFTAYRGWEGVLTLGCAIPLAKICHEFGHAFTAHRYGCRVPAMGLALVVLTPMLYTDTNEAWKLTSRRQRLGIGIAGIAAEMLLALAASWAWLILPDGPGRGAAFILATTTWIMTIALNASPFMRFDGYFILSDLLGIPNLHQRSFAFGRWRLRELLFGLGDPPPEQATATRRRFLVLFAYAVWLYRLLIFLGIALLVYHYFFKALGVFLFAVEIGWFIGHPIYREARSWANLSGRLRFNRSILGTILFVTVSLALLAIPWQGRLKAPAVLSAAREQQIIAPLPAMVIDEPAAGRHTVRAGEVLVRLSSPDLEQRIRQVRTHSSVSRWQVRQQAFDEELLRQGKVPQRRLEGGAAEFAGLNEERDQLTVRAPFDGSIVDRNDELAPGLWLSRKEPLYVIADTARNKVDAYVGERELSRIALGAQARFIPDAPEFGAFSCRVAEVDRVNVPILDDPVLDSAYGGRIASRRDPQGASRPEAPVFRIRLHECSPAAVPALRLRGVAHIEAEKRSLLVEAFRYAHAVVIREMGL